ncbi:interferon lambda receptor 1 [Notolabrus celidotus]|uniref:interferon lambda receptor 1 n=1 Tax=Notolabrus celidotus TaxID=1203425 RepID=UPI00148F9E0B|nr:interferon lambda receptor 1 [Notolabrus celidotus]
MRMWSVKIIILLLFCYACLSTESRKVEFVSRNFFNVLHWRPVERALPGQKVLYSVMYTSDVEGVTYQRKKECQNITALSCDLTNETPSLYDVQYKAQVFANGRKHGHTISFKPLADTTFGPPSLSNYTTVTSLHVNVTLPLGPKGVSVADIITRSKKGPDKTVIVYVLNITHPKWAARVNISINGSFIINLKNNRTEYCGYVVYKPSCEWGRNESEKAHFCTKLQDDPLKILPWLLMGAALLVAVIIISIVLMCCYARGGKIKKTPQLLVTPFNSPPRVLEFPDKNIIISKPEFNTSQGEQTVYTTIQSKPNQQSTGTGGYSPQDIPCPAWQDSDESSISTGTQSLTSNPRDTSNQSSEIYSVVAVHVPAEESTDSQPDTTENRNFLLSSSEESWGKGGTSPNLTTHGVPPLPVLDPYESKAGMPLQLHTVRDSNGQLMLPSLTLQLQSNTGDRERKPLLSDIIDSSKEGPSLASLHSFDSSEWSDSGCDDSSVNTPTRPYCNTNFSPSQPVVPYLQQGCQSTPSSDAMFETGYKQSWMPAVLHEITSKDSCGYLRTNNQCTWTRSKTEEEDEEEDEQGQEDSSREILLGGWGLKINE